MTEQTETEPKLGYPDLPDAGEVYRALLGHGMFAHELPPCFTSKDMLQLEKEELSSPLKKRERSPHSFVSYFGQRNEGSSRHFSIPHPESYGVLCLEIEENWTKINKHAGNPEKKFGFIHVRKIKDKPYIFDKRYKKKSVEMAKEAITQDYYMGCNYVVKADISACFPSIYSHSIPWAIMGKAKAKKNTRATDEGGRKHWSNDLDIAIRKCKDNETNGLLIGPHASSIISEMVLTQIDCLLQAKGEISNNVIRHVDDYVYFSRDEKDAHFFIKSLEIALKEYALVLNQKKTKIIPLNNYLSDEWTSKLKRFNFPPWETIGFPSINAFVDYAISLANAEENQAVINYAMSIVSKKTLSDRAKKLYVKKMLALTLLYPYLLPVLEKYILSLTTINKNDFSRFLGLLFKKGVNRGMGDALAFCFYYALKYKMTIEGIPEKWENSVVELGDCVSILLAWKYAKIQGGNLEPFDEFVKGIKKSDRAGQDKYWLLLYEHAESATDLPNDQVFLKALKKKKISFLKDI